MSELPLAGVRVVSLAINLPGPAAAARLTTLGAEVTKVEPPSGDPLAFGGPDYYTRLTKGQEIVTLNLKDEADLDVLWTLLADTDLLVTSSRPSALARLGLDWSTLHARLPQLCQVAIVGHPGEAAEVAGHDLTYQAGVGTLQPPHMPTVLIADLGGAERAVADGVAALVQRGRTGEGVHREVALSDVAEDMSQPVRNRLTTAEGFLGGALPAYGIYSTASGFIAVAALEGHFWQNLTEQLGVEGSRSDLEAVFTTRTADEWEVWAREHDLPIAAVRSPQPADAKD
ncbi:CoA transferase [Luteipulveratus mongoliensis]|uniref:2-octaprenyl-3-methyl-6-methoxy-1,4-benzoquinol hydroxylase n=1 Tax=Luteipulveratus mongoliensis TaxID=571913 RepID=A0A0K1JDF6_9MICO|nr:CaiB/BaiF CoA-transferase family protein [Luteipulveratus mongoliensis]AKU14640.1 2-octaprenyl-3-methyl-6-methoxy-1,4-benzoquinol hydroxylase [Luteipulveratus mongoliensis]